MSDVLDFENTNIEITDYSDLDPEVKVILITGLEIVGGIPSGGKKSQVLTKLSDNDFDADWADVTTVDQFNKFKDTVNSELNDKQDNLLNSSGNKVESTLANNLDNATGTQLVSGAEIRRYIGVKTSSIYTPQGSINASDIKTKPRNKDTVGFVYNILDSFTTDNTFIDGAGKTFTAGQNIVIVEKDNSYFWDVLSGLADLSNYYDKTEIDNKTSAINTDINNLNEDKVDVNGNKKILIKTPSGGGIGITVYADNANITDINNFGISVYDSKRQTSVSLGYTGLAFSTYGLDSELHNYNIPFSGLKYYSSNDYTINLFTEKQFDDFEQRYTASETNQDNRITDNYNEIEKLKSDITLKADKSDVTEIESTITTIESNITTIQSDVSTAESDIESIDTTLTNIQGSINTLFTDTINLESSVTAIENQLNADNVLWSCGYVGYDSSSYKYIFNTFKSFFPTSKDEPESGDFALVTALNTSYPGFNVLGKVVKITGPYTSGGSTYRLGGFLSTKYDTQYMHNISIYFGDAPVDGFDSISFNWLNNNMYPITYTDGSLDPNKQNDLYTIINLWFGPDGISGLIPASGTIMQESKTYVVMGIYTHNASSILKLKTFDYSTNIRGSITINPNNMSVIFITDTVNTKN